MRVWYGSLLVLASLLALAALLTLSARSLTSEKKGTTGPGAISSPQPDTATPVAATAAPAIEGATPSSVVAATLSATLAATGRFSGETRRNITYCQPEGVAQKMDVYLPPQAEAPAPAVVYVHGGGWTGGDKAQGEGIQALELLASQGYLGVSLNYRLAPAYRFPAQIEDVKCAIRFLRAHAEEYHLDPQRIGVIGASAGGHLVALLGLADESAGWDVGEYLDQSSRVQAVVDLFGPADLLLDPNPANEWFARQVFGASRQDLEPLKLASPVNYITPDAPPFLIIHGDKDRMVPPAQSQALYERLKEAGVPAELVWVKNAGHGFQSGGPISPTLFELVLKILSFFDENLR